MSVQRRQAPAALPLLLLLGHHPPGAAASKLGKPCTTATHARDCGPYLVCDDTMPDQSIPSGGRVCRPCLADWECRADETVCIDAGASDAVCLHKTLAPLDWRDAAGFVSVFFACALAAGGGIGGGGLLVPLLILVLSFSPHEATPLSNVAILGGSVANLIHYAPRQHPSGRKPLIAYDVALMMEPMTILGAIVGAVLNKLFPGWLITVLLVALLSATSRRTMQHGLKYWKKEAKLAQNGDAGAALLARVPELRFTARQVSSERSVRNGVASVVVSPRTVVQEGEEVKGKNEPSEEVAQLLRLETRVPRLDIVLLALLLAASFCLSVLRGNGASESLLHLRCGSYLYWSLVGAQLLLFVSASLGVRRLLIRRYQYRESIGYPFLDDDVRWTPRSSLLWPLCCVGAGLVAGMFGIGGGIIKGPLMLEMGMQPAVSSATSAYMILFTSAAAAMQYFIFGALRVQYGLVLFFVGFVGTAAGQVGLVYLLKAWRRQSLIVLLIATVIGFSAVMMGGVGAYNFVMDLGTGKSLGFHSLCGDFDDLDDDDADSG